MKKKSLLLVVLDLFQIIFSLITIAVNIYIICVNRIASIDATFYGIMFISTILFFVGLSRMKKDNTFYKQVSMI